MKLRRNSLSIAKKNISLVDSKQRIKDIRGYFATKLMCWLICNCRASKSKSKLYLVMLSALVPMEYMWHDWKP